MKKFCPFCNIRTIGIKEKSCSLCSNKINRRYKEYKANRKDTEEQKFYTSKPWRRKRTQIKNRDNGICVVCFLLNKKSKPMDTVHHICELKESWLKRYDNNNLISVCESCHQLIHKEYLKGKYNKEQEQKQLRNLLDQIND